MLRNKREKLQTLMLFMMLVCPRRTVGTAGDFQHYLTAEVCCSAQCVMSNWGLFAIDFASCDHEVTSRGCSRVNVVNFAQLCSNAEQALGQILKEKVQHVLCVVARCARKNTEKRKKTPLMLRWCVLTPAHQQMCVYQCLGKWRRRRKHK